MPIQPTSVTNVVPAIKPGIFPCRFDDINEQSNEQGKFWMWQFTFQVPANKIGDPDQFTPNEDGYALIPITATTSPRITPRTKAAKWIEALRGEPVEVDEEIDFGTMQGLYAMGVIEVVDTGYSRINSLLPADQPAPTEPVAAE
jgi:hypothetical protein